MYAGYAGPYRPQTVMRELLRLVVRVLKAQAKPADDVVDAEVKEGVAEMPLKPA
jgi:hypothetical protein